MINPLTPRGDWHVNSYLKYLYIIQQTCNNENNQTYQAEVLFWSNTKFSWLIYKEMYGRY